MATRQARLEDFISSGEPPSDLPLELLCEDNRGTYVIPFPCHYTRGTWVSIKTGEQIQAAVIGWRPPERRF